MFEKEPVNIIDEYKKQQSIKRGEIAVKFLKGTMIVGGVYLLISLFHKKEA